MLAALVAAPPSLADKQPHKTATAAKSKPPKSGAKGPKGDRGTQGATGATGVAGATGAQGPQGVAGPAGISGYNVVVGPKVTMCGNNGSFSSCQVASSDARCPTGQKVLGGGFYSGVTTIGASLPDNDNGGWYAIASNSTSLSTTYVQAYAICAAVA